MCSSHNRSEKETVASAAAAAIVRATFKRRQKKTHTYIYILYKTVYTKIIHQHMRDSREIICGVFHLSTSPKASLSIHFMRKSFGTLFVVRSLSHSGFPGQDRVPAINRTRARFVRLVAPMSCVCFVRRVFVSCWSALCACLRFCWLIS